MRINSIINVLKRMKRRIAFNRMKDECAAGEAACIIHVVRGITAHSYGRLITH